MFFNIGDLEFKYINKSIDKAEFNIRKRGIFEFIIEESPILDIENKKEYFTLKVKTEYLKIPTAVKGSLGIRNQKKLHFEIASPFEGMAVTDKYGKIIEINFI